MSPIDFLKSYWRVILLVVFVSAALVALFIPGGILADDSFAGNETADGNESTVEESITNLAYGLGLEGGTRIRAPVVGMTAEDVEIDPDREAEVQRTVYQELDLESADVLVRYDQDSGTHTVEVFSGNVSREAFVAALDAADVDASDGDIRDGVTDATRAENVRTIESKINEAGLSGGTVTQQAAVGGEQYIVIEVPDRSPAELRELLSDRGVVTVVAHYPGENGTQTNETVLEREDMDTIGSPSYNEQQDYHYVPITVDPEAASDYQGRMNDLGFTSAQGMENCGVKNPETDEIDFDRGQPNYCLMTVVDGQFDDGNIVDGEIVDAHSMGSDLGSSMASGDWEHDPQFQMISPTQGDARELSINLQAGALRAPLDFENDETFSLEPALADQFKLYSLFIGVLAVITVSVVVYLRYTDVRVAAPMILTALSEVVILLGFVAAIRMPIDLSHVAGFIAVVGTGVDDLIIIADEVMSEGDVNSRRVFDSRFRKAFWVIGAAAATTILAMSPLAVLSLGDLQGFAIVTILGVLIGVLVTRPAYGDILRLLLTKK